MTIGAKTIGLTFSLASPTQVSGAPTKQKIVNTFDLLGDLLSTKRLDNESNSNYKQRLMDVRVHPGGPTYEGVINNLTREFGYTRKPALTISLKTNSSGGYIAENPRVDFLANKVVLYSDWRPDGTETIDKTIYIYEPTSAGYFLEDLITEINSSTCFSAVVDTNVRSNLHSTNLIQTTTDNYVEFDLIESKEKTDLSAQMVIQDSLTFTDATVFDTEVLVTPTTEGEYQIDYTNGIIYLPVPPLGNQGVSYHYADFPKQIDYSMIKVYTLHDDNFTEKLFIQETLDSGEETDALPTTEGSEILHQLFKETNVFWGK